jgi:hypothetical protein
MINLPKQEKLMLAIVLMEGRPVISYDFNKGRMSTKEAIKFSDHASFYLNKLKDKGLLQASEYSKAKSGHPQKRFTLTPEGLRQVLMDPGLPDERLGNLPFIPFKPGYVPAFIVDKWCDFELEGLRGLAINALRDAIIGAPYHRLSPKPGTNPSITESETPSKAWEDFKKDRDASREASGKAQYEEEFVRLFLSHFENGMLPGEGLERWLSFLKRHEDVRQRMVNYYQDKKKINGDLANIAATDGEILRLLERPDMELSKVVARAGSLVKSYRHYVP